MSPTIPKLSFGIKYLSGSFDVLKKLWQKDKKFLIQYGITVISLVVVITFIFFPLFFKIHMMKSQAKNLSLEIRTSKSKIARIPELKEKTRLYSKQIENMQKRFLQIRDLDQLIGDISKLSAQNGVVLTGSRPVTDKQQALPEPYGKKYLAASYELVFEGGYHQLGKFLSDFEQLDRLLLVRDLSIRAGSGDRLEKLQCTIHADAFVQTPEGI